MIELAITPDGRWDVTPEELAGLAAARGFSGVGLAAGGATAAVREAYDRWGVTCHEVLAVVVTDDHDATLAAAERAAQAAATMAAPWVLTVYATELSPASARLIAQCAERYRAAGAAMAVEFSPLGPIGTIGAARRVAEAARAGGAAGVLVDSWHFCLGDSTWEDLEAIPLDEIAYLQFTDALPGEGHSLGRQTMHMRALPGEGVLELDRFAGTLRDRGYDGVVSVEVLSAQLRAQPAGDIVRDIAATTAPYWR